jgi:hypothetical protein
MTNLEGSRIAGGCPTMPKRSSSPLRRKLTDRIVRDAPDEELSTAPTTPRFAALGLLLAIALSAVLWTLIIGAIALLLR